jgi:flagellar basal-body rod protein FlgB
MDPMNLFDKTTDLLRANLDRRGTAQNLMSRNLANVDTPDFRGTGLEFEKQLRAAMEGGVLPPSMARTNPRHMPLQPERPMDKAAPEFKDIGPVQLDVEMSKLAENNIMFNAMVQLLNKKYTLLKTAIADGGGSQ